MTLSAAALAAYFSMCAPSVAPDTMRAIVAVESGGNPYALNDNTAHRSYAPQTEQQARTIVLRLLAQGHSVDVGLAQVNSGNFTALHVDATRMLEPCANLTVASRILANDYARALTVSSNQHDALWRAISAYNTGSLFAGRSYVAAVIAQAQRASSVPTISVLTASSQSQPPPAAPASAASSRPTTTLNLEAAAAEAPLSSSRHAGVIRTLEMTNHAPS